MHFRWLSPGFPHAHLSLCFPILSFVPLPFSYLPFRSRVSAGRIPRSRRHPPVCGSSPAPFICFVSSSFVTHVSLCPLSLFLMTSCVLLILCSLNPSHLFFVPFNINPFCFSTFFSLFFSYPTIHAGHHTMRIFMVALSTYFTIVIVIHIITGSVVTLWASAFIANSLNIFQPNGEPPDGLCRETSEDVNNCRSIRKCI